VLTEARLISVHLEKANLRRADLSGVSWFHPYLEGADLRGAKLYGALIENGSFERAILAGAELKGLKYSQFVKWPPGFDPVEHGASPFPPGYQPNLARLS
jgi:uncharacterized protein YjbI with pentapeptide repeats